jgi:hypothetical protein
MDNPDDAVLTAADRAREAQERLVETPTDSPEIVPKAHAVEHRAEEIEALAEEAAEEAEQ